MKIKGAKKVHYDSGPNMTPLVDVVMVILIFLMLAGSFGATSHYLTSNLPITKGGAGAVEPEPGKVPDEIFEVQIVSDPNYGFRVMAGSIKSTGRTPDRDWMSGQFTAKREAYDTAGGTPGEAIQVVISPAGSVQYEHIAMVYEAALRAKFKKVAFRTAQ